MNIVIHPGLNKTGTTSIQQYLFRTIASDEPQRIWYPKTTIHSPGHTALSLAFKRSVDEGAVVYAELLERAERGGVEMLIISQENLLERRLPAFDAIRERSAGHPIHLILTLSRFADRAVSLWQENIKHGAVRAIEDPGFLPARHTFNARFLPAVIRRLRPAKASVILSDRQAEPERLLLDFMQCIGIREFIEGHDKRVDPSLRINNSYGRVESEILRHLNLASEHLRSIGIAHDQEFIRRNLSKVMRSDAWRQAIPRHAIEVADAWRPILERLGRETGSELLRLRDAGSLEIIGDLELLTAPLSPPR